jgi:hypothetical protein
MERSVAGELCLITAEYSTTSHETKGGEKKCNVDNRLQQTNIKHIIF